jgi:perosamine synthetase
MRTIPLAEPWIVPEAVDAVARQIESGFIGPGPATQAFAEALARLADVPYCVPTVSGTVALSVAAKALGLAPGDQILVPAYGVISTINAFATIGLAPRLVEINRQTGCLDPDRLRAAIRPQTKAVCFVNFSGRTGPELLETVSLCAQRNLPLIEDAACALGQRLNGKAAGSFGTIGIYSFSVPKVLTTGQGGAVLLKSEAHRDRATSSIDLGDTEWRRTNLNNGIGSNLRFNDILAAFGLAQLPRLDERLARRRSAYAAMKAVLGDALYGVPGDEAPLHNIVFCRRSDQLVAELQRQGIRAIRQYRALYQHPPYRHLHDGVYAASEFWTDCAVYLPFGMTLTGQNAELIARAVLSSGLELLPSAQ